MNEKITVHSLNEYHQTYNYKLYLEEINEENASSKKTASSFISGVIFYFTIISMVLIAFVYSQRSETGNNVFGFSYFNILTTSMQSELPQGSFILVKAVDPTTLKVGDDITFFESETKVITHRIINIYEDYEDSGYRGFETQGVDNKKPDDYVTMPPNVIGKVIWSVPHLGFILDLISSNIIYFAGAFILLFVLSMFIKVAITPDKKQHWMPDDEKQSDNITLEENKNSLSNHKA